MKKSLRIMGFVWMILMGMSTAGITATPKFSIIPLQNPTFTVPDNETANIRYRVTNNTKLTRTLTFVPITGVTQETSEPGSCPRPFTLTPGASCTLDLFIEGSALPASGIHGGPIVCKARGASNPTPDRCLCSQPAIANRLNVSRGGFATTTLALSLSELALVTQGILTEASGAGVMVSSARTLTVTNTGVFTANNVGYTINPALPAGTTILPANCGDIDPLDTCTLTITPGNTSSSGATAPTLGDGSAPTASTITVQGTNTNAPTSDIYILTYGDLYKGGYIFSFDDDKAINLSAGGKVFENIPGGDFLSVWGPGGVTTGATSDNSGVSNQSTIVNNFNISNYPAFNRCFTIAGGNWYLPARCEMTYGQLGICGTVLSPDIQNIQSNLYNNAEDDFEIDPVTLYWSSTEDESNTAWTVFYNTANLSPGTKASDTNIVRCAMIF